MTKQRIPLVAGLVGALVLLAVGALLLPGNDGKEARQGVEAPVRGLSADGTAVTESSARAGQPTEVPTQAPTGDVTSDAA